MLKKWNLFKGILFGSLSMFCIGYYVVCIAYAGFGLSWIWIWPLMAVFSFIRSAMLLKRAFKKVKENNKKRKNKSDREQKRKKRFLWSFVYRVCLITAVIAFIYVESLVYSGMQSIPQDDLDYIIVLGAGIRRDAPTRPFLLRMQTAAEYMERNPNTIAIASGAQGPKENMSEAQCIYNYLTDKGVSPERIIIEDQSRNTEQNIKNSFAYIPEGVGDVGIVSNGFHIYRSTRIAQKQGHDNVIGIPTRTLLPVGIHYAVREFFAIVELEVLK